jgi:hypothetical protein
MVNSKDKLLMENISKFYNTKNINDILPITQGHSKLSLRVLDWFVTNYCKTYNIILNDKKNNYNVYLDYKSQLKAFSKKQFDPFCRRERIVFYYDKKDFITTTVGQLNFFKWAIENNILEYVNNNLKTIEENMNKSCTLRISGSKKINKNDMDIIIAFQ